MNHVLIGELDRKFFTAAARPTNGWSPSEDIGSVRAVAKARNMQISKAEAFMMGMCARVGSESLVRQLTRDCVDLVLMSYYSLPYDYFEAPRPALDYKDILKIMR